MAPDVAVLLFELGIITVVGLAFFWTIWDCARKNFRSIVAIAVKNDEITSKFMVAVLHLAETNNLDTTELQGMFDEYGRNIGLMRDHKL